MCRMAVFFGDELARYGFGQSHQFNSNRLLAFWSKFNELELQNSGQIEVEHPEIAHEETIYQFHDRTYIDFVRHASKLGSGYLDLGDTPAFLGAFEASSYVVGTSLRALNLVMDRLMEFNMHSILLGDYIMQEGAMQVVFAFLTI